MKKTAFFLFALFSVCLTANMFAQEVRQNFVLVNKTCIDIHAVFVTPHSSADWGENVLGKDVMEKDDEWEIQFQPKEKSCKWDLRIEDKDGNYVEWESIDLCEYGKITIYYDGKKASATFE
ncbi:MAG: hypothetical protein ACM3S2_21160 [Ignavibacteriales bacterium]